MGKIRINKDFFKNRSCDEKKPQETQSYIKKTNTTQQIPSSMRFDDTFTYAVQKAKNLLDEMGQKKFAQLVEQTSNAALNDRFTVAVVGEFSRGKSTFVNRLLGKDILPVGNLPTTAMLTRIRYNQKPMLICFDSNGKQKAVRPLASQSWDDLVAHNFDGGDPKGTALVGCNDEWLKQTNVEIMDTPGAGDLEESRARVLSDALLRADGAIITISATQALSMSEKLFIEQRLISRKTPFLMLILTKLDQVPQKDRVAVVDYVFKKLASMKLSIPVYIPYEIDMPDSKYSDIIGLDKIKEQIVVWINDPKRVELTQQWVISRIQTIISTATDAISDEKALLQMGEEEKEKNILKKQGDLSKAEICFEDLCINMLERSNECFKLLMEKADEFSNNIVERLQYEATVCGNPQKWYNDSYAYRTKIELTNMATALNNHVTKRVAEDVRWFNTNLEQQFKTRVMVENEAFADKTMFNDFDSGRQVVFEDLDKRRNIARIGTVALTLAGSMLCLGLGAYPLVATMGIGTGSSIITENVFKGKVEKQREAIKDAIKVNIPQLVTDALSESEKRVRALYDDVINQAKTQQNVWVEAQQDVISKSEENVDYTYIQNLESQISALKELSASLANIGDK